MSLERYFLALMQQRRRNPGNDLMSLLLAGQAEGRLSAAARAWCFGGFYSLPVRFAA